MILRIVMILALLVVLFGTYVRVAGANPEQWHVDPDSASSPGNVGYQIRSGDSPVWAEAPQDLIAAMQAIALDTPRTALIAGAASEAHLTFETRSLIWGFPDYTTVKAVAGDVGTTLSVIGRARYGAADVGVNQARIEAWMAALAERFPPQ